MPAFVRSYPVRFEDCDGAGIVFYPRLVLLVNRVIEDWFADGLGVDFRELHEARRLAIPTVDLHLRFLAASRLGERLDVALTVKRLGSRSFTLGIEARCGDEVRFTADSVLVCADQVEAGVKSRTLPDDLRAGMEGFLASAAGQ